MEEFEKACNVVEFFSDNGDVVQSKRIYVVVDGKNQEFQKELDRYALSRVMELENIKDHRTDCVLRYYRVRESDVDAFQQAVLDLAEHMPALGYPDYEEYALKALVEYGCIAASEAQEQTGRECEEPLDLSVFPDALFNVCGLRTDLPKRFFWKDVMVIEGREKEARRLLLQHGFDNLMVKEVHVHKDWPQYVLFMCSVSQSRWDEFVDVMHDVERNMLIRGYRDYEEACTAIFHELKVDPSTEEA